MTSTVHRASVCFALLALLVRALLPVGWMPNPAGTAGTPIILCTVEGGIPVFLGLDGKPLKNSPADDHTQHSDGCPFAATPHVATATVIVAATQPSLAVSWAVFDFASRIGSFNRQFSLASPRAPPTPV
jgi:hypothetical protein